MIYLSDAVARREALRRTSFLLGGEVSPSTVAGVLGGCGRSDRTIRAPWQPRILTADQNCIVVLISEHILPEADAPGANRARINEFIDEMLANYFPAKERQSFLAGLTDLDMRARRAHAKRFLACTPEHQTAILSRLDEETFAPRTTDTVHWIWGEPPDQDATQPPFWRTMKELTLVAYYTADPRASEPSHDAPSGHHTTFIPFAQVGRNWSV